MTRHNYRQAKRSREDVRKRRQLEKQERKLSKKAVVGTATTLQVDAPASDLKPSP